VTCIYVHEPCKREMPNHDTVTFVSFVKKKCTPRYPSAETTTKHYSELDTDSIWICLMLMQYIYQWEQIGLSHVT